jgi:hypothetical protein
MWGRLVREVVLDVRKYLIFSGFRLLRRVILRGLAGAANGGVRLAEGVIGVRLAG